MNTDNMLIYIKMGLGIKPERKQYVVLSLFPLISTVMMGLVPAVILKGMHLTILIILSIISIADLVVIAILSSKSYTVKNRLIMQTVIYLGMVLTISLLEMSFGVLLVELEWIMVTYIPVIIIPIISGLRAYKQITSDTPYSHKKFISSRLKASSFIWGLIGANFAAIFRNAEQRTVIIIVLILFTTLNSLLSFGLLSIQRLYYANKLIKQGVCIDDK